VISTLLLDFDGVLGFQTDGYIEAMNSEYAWTSGADTFLHELTHHPDEAAAIRGHGNILDLVQALLPQHVSELGAQEFFDRWLDEGIRLDTDLLALLPRIRIARTFLATNQERYRGAAITRRLDGQAWLTGTLVSCDIGYAKPDAAYFTTVLDRIGAQPSECLFVDDKPRNVAAAVALGIPSIHFQGVPALCEELAHLSLI
jgi:putative hydrolase of the HAD superfamily